MFRVDQKGNQIHKTAIIDPTAKLGHSNYFGPYVVVHNDVEIGNHNIFESHVSVGSPAEHAHESFNRMKIPQRGKVLIGNNNHFREFVTINKPTKVITQVKNNCYVMRGGHISHDTVLEDKVIMSCDVLLGGHSHIHEGAYMGLGCKTHPHIVIGSYAMIGMGSVVTKIIEPFMKAYGTPAKVHGENTVGIERHGIDEITRKRIEKEFLQ